MDRVQYVKPDFPADAFAGTATYYAKHRPPYPKALTEDLLARARIPSDARLLDLACGPGRISIPLAAAFREVWAIDLEPEMIEVGQQEARRRGVANIRWLVGRAENLEAAPASFQLITIGAAFHRLDQRRIAEKASQWLARGCCLATMGCYEMSGTEPWKRIVADVVRKWTNRTATRSNSSGRIQPESGPAHNELVLQDAGFEEVDSYAFVHRLDWSVESILGYLYSTSSCSKNVLAARVEAFETDLKHALLAYDPSGHYRESMRCGYTLGRKPQ